MCGFTWISNKYRPLLHLSMLILSLTEPQAEFRKLRSACTSYDIRYCSHSLTNSISHRGRALYLALLTHQLPQIAIAPSFRNGFTEEFRDRKEIVSVEPCRRSCSASDQAHLEFTDSYKKILPLGCLPDTRHVRRCARAPLSFAPMPRIHISSLSSH